LRKRTDLRAHDLAYFPNL